MDSRNNQIISVLSHTAACSPLDSTQQIDKEKQNGSVLENRKS